MLDAEYLTASLEPCPTNSTINDDNLWSGESLELPNGASLAMQNDLPAF